MGEFVIEYYKMGLYSDAEMDLFVEVGWITQEQYDTAKAEMGR